MIRARFIESTISMGCAQSYTTSGPVSAAACGPGRTIAKSVRGELVEPLRAVTATLRQAQGERKSKRFGNFGIVLAAPEAGHNLFQHRAERGNVMNTVIANATIITGDPARTILYDSAIAIQDGVIASLGANRRRAGPIPQRRGSQRAEARPSFPD